MCLEICREANGANYCDKRRTRDELSKEFPSVDFAGLVENEDVHFNPVKRETIAEVVQRAEKFVDFILKRREETIVVVSHGVFLEVLLRHTVLAEFDHLYRSDLRGMPLSNCEVRSVSVCESHGGIAGEAGTCNSNMDTE
jgi:broad specificity phosphatase PhoE